MKVEVWSDLVCPWCYIGKRRLEHALARYEHAADVEVIWRSFQLDPTQLRGENIPTFEMLSRKHGVTATQAKAMNDRVTDLAAAEGLAYRLDKAVTANTFDAQRLTHLAGAHHLGDAMHERLLRAALIEGEPIDDIEVLVRLAVDVGLPAEAARYTLEAGEFADQVHEDISQARALGVNGVPFYVVDRAFGMSGAQSVDTILDVLRRADTSLAP
ncbi:DsbA family oxidoreductase [Nocardia sp. NPDC059240]|uniref:DsbA family oxidoreductase n=1 Tax=Nocardia sp. NPDC059240 TaxID=3346786 RepID=UPI0036D13418